MVTLNFRDLEVFLQTNWGWAAGLAASMFGLTLLAGGLLNPARKDEIALWLMGAESEENWSKSFVSLFDAVFGERHFSLRCFARSTVASLVAVALIWVLMGEFGALGVRLQAELSLGAVLVIALGVNVVADYVSLLETRLLLGQMHRLRSFLAHAAVLVFDLIVSGAIIWAAILVYVASPLHQGEIESFAEIVGVFSIFSVMFYSTFLTSVWTWAYILSAWIMRLFARLRLADLLDVENKPIRVLASILALVVFVGALGLTVPMQKNADGLTAADRALCSVFEGPVCLDVAQLTEAERAQLELIMLACRGGLTGACVSRGLAVYEVACDGGDPIGCTGLIIFAYNLQEGIGAAADPAAAARLYRRACKGGDARGCIYLGFLHQQGIGMAPDPAEAARLYRLACEGGEAVGCTGLAFLHGEGIGMAPDPAEAARLYRRGCEGGYSLACKALGFLYEGGKGVAPDPAEAARLYRRACGMGDGDACAWAEELTGE